MLSSMFLLFKRLVLSEHQRQVILVDGTGNDGVFDNLADDLVVEILRRLPAEHLWWGYRMVCKRWYALISSPSFAHAHLRQSPSTFFVSCLQKGYPTKLDFVFPPDGDDANISGFVAWFLKERLVERWKLRDRGVLPFASCNGLILFSRCWSSGSIFFPTEAYVRYLMVFSTRIGSRNQICIGNPITGELLTIHNPSMFTLNGFCGFFYHSSTQEYKLLHCHKPDGTDLNYIYAMLTLGSTEWRSLGNFPHRIRPGSSPVILDNTLYWMTHASFSTCEDSIIMFNMDSEEFRTMPHPSYSCQINDSHDRMNLLEMDGRLTCWCVMGQYFCAWALDVSGRNNYTPGSWVQIYHLDYYPSFKRHFTQHVPDNHDVKLVSVQNRELVLFWCWKRVFCCNLLTKSVRKFSLGGVNDLLNEHLPPIRYSKSVVSLQNFYPGLSEVHVAWPKLC
ncbi:hypothetical protein V6N13_009665 [Hibiscus sabdariffa]|uniref:Uncharacterized protein n=2 Tax=Hibiscus sabdariffa TaxID=183260 RepID=A0ABR2B4Y3_9ROSI